MSISTTSVVSLVLLAAALGIFSYFAVNNVHDFVNQPYVVTTSRVATSAMLLPDITICPVAWMGNNSDKYDKTLIEFMMNGFLDTMLVKVPYQDDEPFESRNQTYNDFVASHPNFNLKTFMQNLQSECSDELVYCDIGGARYTKECCDWFATPRILKNVGGCWTLNGRINQAMSGPGGGMTLYLRTSGFTPTDTGIIRNTLPAKGYVLFIDDKPAISRGEPIFVSDGTMAVVGLSATKHESTTNCLPPEKYPETVFFEFENMANIPSKQRCIYDCIVQQITRVGFANPIEGFCVALP